MCGLMGVAGDYINKDHWNAFEQLLYCSAVRGWDAAGVAVVYKTPVSKAMNWEIVKKTGPSLNVISSPEYGRLFNKHFDLKAVIGHCRAATVGKNEEQNAHPFEFKHVVGAHNGTLNRRPHNQKQFETDSEALYADINARGVGSAIPDVTGAWALTWYDQFQGTLNFLRNDQRDLYIAVLKHTDTIFWASEAGLLEWVLRRFAFEVDTMVRVKPDLHIRFKIGERQWLDTLETSEVKGGVPTTYFRQEVKENPPVPFEVEKKAEGPPPSTSCSKIVPMGTNIVPIGKPLQPRAARIKWRKGWKGEQFEESEYQALLDEGCAFCGVMEHPNHPHRWIDRESYLCEECKDSYGQSILVN